MGWAKSSSRRDSGVENSTMLPYLEEAVVAPAAKFGEALFEGIGEVEDWARRCGLGGFFCGGLLWAWGLLLPVRRRAAAWARV